MSLGALASKYIDWTPLFGFDFFISYRRTEAAPYASTLEKRLRAADFRCFLDDNDAAPGRSLTLRLKWALRKTRTLIIVATPGVTDSKWVGEEIRLFSQLGRDILPISIEDGLSRAFGQDQSWKVIADRNYLWLSEEPSVSGSDEPSDRVIGEIQKSFRHRRASGNLRIALSLVGVVLAGIAGYAMWQKTLADNERAAAVAAEKIAIEQRNVAIEKEREAREAQEAESKAKEEATRQAEYARRQAERATRASLAEIRARKVATSRQLAAEARFIAQEQPDLGLLLALESRRVSETVESRRALWEGLVTLGHLRRYDRSMHGKILALSYSPERQMFAAGDSDGNIRLWNGGRSEAIELLRDHEAAVASLAFSPSGRRLASASYDQTIVVWDLERKAVLRRLPGPNNTAVLQVAFLEGEDRVVVTDASGVVATYELMGDKMFRMRRIMHRPDANLRMAVGRSGKIIALGGDDGTVTILRRGDDTWQKTGEAEHAGGVASVALSTNEQTLYTGGQNGDIRRWDVPTLTERGEVSRGDADPIYAIAVTPDGRRLLSAGGGKAIVRWELREGQPTLPVRLNGHARAVFSIAIGADGREFVSGGGDHAIIHWSFDEVKRLSRRSQASSAKLFSVVFSPTGKELSTSGLAGIVQSFDVRTLTERWSAKQLSGIPVGELRYAEENTIALATGRGLYIWPRDQVAPRPISAKTSEGIYRVALNSGGNVALTGAPSGEVALWSIESGRKLWATQRSAHDARAVAIDPRGKRGVVSGESKEIQVFDAEDGHPIGAPLKGHSLDVLDLKFQPHGELVASASLDGTIRLWSLRKSRGAAELTGRMGPVMAIAFSPDGKLLAGATRIGAVALWDVDARSLLAVLTGVLTSTVTSVAFSPDGAWLAAVDEDGSIARWAIGHDVLVREACEIIGGRRLTVEEQIRYLGRRLEAQACDGHGEDLARAPRRN